MKLTLIVQGNKYTLEQTLQYMGLMAKRGWDVYFEGHPSPTPYDLGDVNLVMEKAK